MAYTDLTSEFDYKDLLTWQNMDKLAENDNYFKALDVAVTGDWAFTNAGTDTILTLTQNGVQAANKPVLSIYSNVININSELARMQQNNASSTKGCLRTINAGTGTNISIEQDGVLAASNYGLYVYSNAAQINAGYLLFLEQDNASSTSDVAYMQNDGTGTALAITQVGINAANKPPISIYSNAINVNAELARFNQANASSSLGCARFINAGTGTNTTIEQDGILTAGNYGLHVYSNADQDNAIGLARIHIDNASSDASSVALWVLHDGTANGCTTILSTSAAADNNYGFFTTENIAAANKAAFISDAFINGESSINLKVGDVVKLKGTETKYFINFKTLNIPVNEVVLADVEDDKMTVGIVCGRSGKHPDDTKQYHDDGYETEPNIKCDIVTCGAYAHCLADASFGAIKVGDRLCSSNNSGHARKAVDERTGFNFAVALENLDSGIGYIGVLVNKK